MTECEAGVRDGELPEQRMIRTRFFLVVALSLLLPELSAAQGLERLLEQRSTLIDSLTTWLSEHPEATLGEAAGQGDELIARLGFPFDLKVEDTDDGDAFVRSRAENHPCGEAWLNAVPLTHARVGAPLLLPSGELEPSISERLTRVRARLFDPATGRELPAIALPTRRYGSPHRVTGGGRILRWRVRLDGADDWWGTVREGSEIARSIERPTWCSRSVPTGGSASRPNWTRLWSP